MLLLLLLLSAPAAAPAAPRTATARLRLFAGGQGCAPSGPGTADRPFCSPDAAVRAAPPGATVLLRAGSYPLLRLERVTKARPVTVAPVAGGRVVVAGIELTDVR